MFELLEEGERGGVMGFFGVCAFDRFFPSRKLVVLVLTSTSWLMEIKFEECSPQCLRISLVSLLTFRYILMYRVLSYFLQVFV